MVTFGCMGPRQGNPSKEIQAIEQVLDDFHDAAAQADEARYFGHLAPGAVFMGTDPGERWTREEFRAWAKPYFKDESAWTFIPRDRFVFLGGGDTVAWFDEVAESAHYGACRGTGVLVKRSNVWKIAHYNLTLPIPNDQMKDVLRVISGENANQASKIEAP
jgi:ketosteroid isomerase-like protein